MFACLVGAQDRGAAVGLARRGVAARFGVTLADVLRAEAEGLARLSAAVRAATHGVLGDTPS